MIIRILITLFFLISIGISAYADYQTNLLPGVYIQNNGVDLDVGSWSAPTVYDWNSDGKKDLLIGQNTGGKGYISYYENIGTNAAPLYNGSTYIQSCSLACNPLNAIAGG